MADPTDADLARVDDSDLHRRLSGRLASLPPDAYLRCLALFMTQYRQLFHQEDPPEAYRRIVEDIVGLTVRAAAGERVRDAAVALDRRWRRLTYPDLEDDDVQPYAGPLDLNLFRACGDALWELTHDAHRHESAGNIAEGALHYDEPGDQLANVRLMLWFIDQVDREAAGDRSAPPARTPRVHSGGHGDWHRVPLSAGPLTIRRAGPGDVPAVLDLLDESVAWLRDRGLQQWLLWPSERDTVAPAVDRGEVWLARTGAGDVAGTVTLAAGGSGAALWGEGDRQAAMYLSRLAVRRALAGRGLGARILDWALLRAGRHGGSVLRVAAWPGNPRLHEYLRGRGLRELWTVANPLATSRTLFTSAARPADPARASRHDDEPAAP
jgi:GNAT superfamily N-acetyltransferase